MIRTKLHTLSLSGKAVKGGGEAEKERAERKREGYLEKRGDKGGVTARGGGREGIIPA